MRSLLMRAAALVTMLGIVSRVGTAQASRIPDARTLAAVDSLLGAVFGASHQRDTTFLRQAASPEAVSAIYFLSGWRHHWPRTGNAVPEAELPKPCRNGATLWRAYGVYPHGALPPVGRYLVVKFTQVDGRWRIALVGPAPAEMVTLPCCSA